MDNNTILEVPVEQDEVKKEEFDPVEQSGIFIDQAHKEFKRLSYGLSDKKKRAVARVLEAVLFEPLEKVELIGKQEEQLFAICQQVMYHKGVLLRYTYERMEKIKKGEIQDERTEEEMA